MKRDLDLIRQMLLLIEESKDVPPNSLDVDDFLDLNDKAAVIALHIGLLADAGFVEVEKPRRGDITDWSITRMTFVGYEYLDAVRNDRIWRNVKTKIGELGGASFDIIKELAASMAKQYLGLS